MASNGSFELKSYHYFTGKRRIKGSDPIQCPICETTKIFKQSRNLTAHLSEVHEAWCVWYAKKLNIQGSGKEKIKVAARKTYLDSIDADEEFPAELVAKFRGEAIFGPNNAAEPNSGSVESQVVEDSSQVVEDSSQVVEDSSQVVEDSSPEVVEESTLEVIEGDARSTSIPPQEVFDDQNASEKDVQEKPNDSAECITSSEKLSQLSSQISDDLSDEDMFDNFPQESNRGNSLSAPTNVTKKYTQRTLDCLTCVQIDAFTKVHHSIIKQGQEALNNCKCPDTPNGCCCHKRFNQMMNSGSEADQQPQSEKEDLIKINPDDTRCFFEISNELFCYTCLSQKVVPKRRDRPNFVNKGVDRNHKSIKIRMKNHLSMDHHIQAVKQDMKANGGFTSDVYTRNLMQSGVFLAKCKQPYRFLTELAAFVQRIMENVHGQHTINPLGNRGHAHSQVPKILKACHSSVVQTKKLELTKNHPGTLQPPRIFVSADMGTARQDGHRQAVVFNYFDAHGKLQEYVASVGLISGGDAETALNHVKKSLKELLDLKTVCGGSSDGASVYAGCNNGMWQLAKRDEEFDSNLVFLPDYCHRAELLMVHGKVDWVHSTIIDSSNLVNVLHKCSGLTNFIVTLNKEKLNEYCPWWEIQTYSKTRFFEFTHKHLAPLLVNVPLLADVIPSYIEEPDVPPIEVTKLKGILKTLTTIEFLCQVYLLDIVSVEISKKEKKAQGKIFTGFDYREANKSLKLKLAALKDDPLLYVKDLMVNKVFKYEVEIDGEPREFSVQLAGYEDGLPTTRANSAENLKAEEAKSLQAFEKLKENFRTWVAALLKKFDQFLEMPEILKIGCKIFEDHCNEEEDRFTSFKEIIPLLTMSYKKCSEFCEEIQCNCCQEEFRRFWNFYIGVRRSKKNVNEALLFFMDSRNDDLKDLGIVNVIRVIEIFLLLKPSQSSCERVMSIIQQIVRGRFEHNYKIIKDLDVIDITTLLNLNCDFNDFDDTLAAQIFLEAGSKPAITRDPCQKGKAINTCMNKTSKINEERKKANLKMVNLKATNQAERIQSKELRTAKIVSNTYVNDENDGEEVSLVQENELPSTRTSDETVCEDMNIESPKKDVPLKEKEKERVYWFGCCENYDYTEELTGKTALLGCSNAENCNSAKRLFKVTGYPGGDWWHFGCLNIECEPQGDWYCKECGKKLDKGKKRKASPKRIAVLSHKKIKLEGISKPAANTLKKQKIDANPQAKVRSKQGIGKVANIQMEEDHLAIELEKEGMILDPDPKVPYDGHCLYTTFSVLKYGHMNKWEDIRNEIYDKMEDIFLNPTYENLWHIETRPNKMQISLNPELAIIKNIVRDLEDFDLTLSVGDKKFKKGTIMNKGWISKDERRKYIEIKRKGVHWTNMYGGVIERFVFSHIENQNIWTLKNIIFPDGSRGYNWEQNSALTYHVSHKEIGTLPSKYRILYTNYGSNRSAHFRPIIRRNNDASLPICNKSYSYLSKNVTTVPCACFEERTLIDFELISFNNVTP